MAQRLLSDSGLRPYLDDVRAWHGFVRFLGLPTIQDHPDTPLSDLFVAPALSAQRVSAESQPSTWPIGQNVFAVLESQPRLVVLGDPGSGKSMIVNWLAWLLAGGAYGVLPSWLEDVLPIPLVARELKLDGVKRFDDLLAAFLDRPVAAQLAKQPDALHAALEEGRAMVLLDGLDEVPFALRESLREAVLDGWQRYPRARFLATSRIVGYDECRLDLPKTAATDDIKPGDAWSRELRTPLMARDATTPVFYVMPFDDARIAAFAQQWYRLRSIKPAAEQDASAFVRALQPEANVLELARTPQLLTLMALVYRVRAHLPDGRAMLYDMITEAYLESIDRARMVGAGSSVVDRYPWREKRRWLARVGFEMQLLRGERRDAEETTERELLATRSQVLAWVRDAMRRSSYPADDAFAAAYLDWVARRSGLLLPRGEDLFAFVHLSFQEYFAALYLFEHLSDADWVIAQRDGATYTDGDERVNAAALAGWSMDTLWQETLVFAHECFAHNPKDARRLSGWLFGEGFADFRQSLEALDAAAIQATPWRHRDALARGELLARLLTNPHSGLAAPDREAGMEVAMVFLDRAEGRFDDSSAVRTSALRRLLASPDTRAEFWAATRKKNPQRLNLLGHWSTDLNDLSELTRLESLTASVLDLNPLSTLAHLHQLRELWLIAPGVTSLAPLARLNKLHTLYIDGPQVSDLGPLASLERLVQLHIVEGPVSDISALRHLKVLDLLDIDNTKVTSLVPLRTCKAIKTLNIRGTPVEDLSPLDDLPNLARLGLSKRHKLTQKLRAKQAAGKLDVTVIE